MKKSIRVILLILFFTSLFYFTFIYESDKSKELKLELKLERKNKERINENKRVERELKLERLIDENNPNVIWDSILSKGETYRFSQIYSHELEELWVNNSESILFKGEIIDIKTLDSLNYNLIIERNIISSFNYMFKTKLRLSLSCSKAKIDTIMDENDFEIDNYYPTLNQFFVIARIDKILTTDILNDDKEAVQVRIGAGKLIEIIYFPYDFTNRTK
jgi:hypothetical protein